MALSLGVGLGLTHIRGAPASAPPPGYLNLRGMREDGSTERLRGLTDAGIYVNLTGKIDG
ncbi:MAG TPA: hypothetical protein VLA00_17130 [Xanthobacteraceae bacterium]|nr:hypothetical protein [Xanthobacteraceae bacterium]